MTDHSNSHFERTAMAYESFLGKIYKGSLDKKVFDSIKAIVDREKIDSLKNKFLGILEEYPPQLVESRGSLPREMLKKMGEIGLFGISIPEAYGGLGLNLWEYLKVVEEMAKLDISVVLVSLAHLSIGVKGVVLFGNESQKKRYLPPAASGDMIFSYALTEPAIGSDAQHIETTARLSEDGDHYILNGRKAYITNANYAGVLTVFAQMDPERPGFMGAFIVETGWEGVKIGKDMPKMGLKGSSTAAIQLREVRVPRENLLGAPGEGFKIAMSILNYGRLGLSAASVGIMDQSLSDMLKRSSSRIQFGVPIKNFPLIQEKLVAARVHSFAVSTMNDFTASMLEEDPIGNVAIESSHCKLMGTTFAWDTLYDALQVAGGAGYLSTLPYEKRMRDFRVTTVFEGTTEIHSIYPPLFAMRSMQKEWKTLNMDRFSQLALLLKSSLKRMEWPIEFDQRITKKASRLAKANARTIRRLLFLGMLLFGKKASEKEFFLRRITSLSTYLFGLLSILARILMDQGSCTSNSEELNLLRYFVEEAKEARKRSRRIFNSRKENLSGVIIDDLFRRESGESDLPGSISGRDPTVQNSSNQN